MTVISIKPGNAKDIQRIELADGSLFSFKTYYLPDNAELGEGLELNTDEEENLRFAAACLRAEKAALQLIARAEQTVFNLSMKLEKRGHESSCVRAVMAHLCESGLLDDSRYARLWLESRISRQASSPRRLRAALHSRGIDRNDSDTALKETLDDETEQQLLERYVKKIKSKFDNSAENQRSLKYTLKSEGFSSAAIQYYFEKRELI